MHFNIHQFFVHVRVGYVRVVPPGSLSIYCNSQVNQIHGYKMYNLKYFDLTFRSVK